MNFSPDTGHSAACDKSREGQLWVSSMFGTCQPAHWPSGRGRHWDCSVNSPQEHHCCFPEACPCPEQVRTVICLMHNRFPIILAKCQRDCWDYLGIALSVQRVFFSLGINTFYGTLPCISGLRISTPHLYSLTECWLLDLQVQRTSVKQANCWKHNGCQPKEMRCVHRPHKTRKAI